MFHIICFTLVFFLDGIYARFCHIAIDEEVAKKVLNGAERITCRPADLLSPEYEEIKKRVIELGYYEKEEDVLSYAVFEQVAENFFKWREAQKKGVDRDLAKSGVYPV